MIWLSLSLIDWRTILHIEEASNTTEEKLGDLLWESIQKSEEVITNDSVIAPLDSILDHICDKNGIKRKDIKLHLIRKDEINAFAMPDNHLIVYTGLIEACTNEAELAGVLCHELAHIQKHHVMKKLVKEIGLGVLVSLTTGGGNTAEVFHLLSSSAYDRKLETEADLTAVEYLIEADINPEPFADFLFMMGQEHKDLPKAIYWITTHPESEERATEIINKLKDRKYLKKPVLDDATWETFKKRVKEEQRPSLH